jgi:hypothetical protein
VTASGHELLSPLAKPPARFRPGSQHYFDVPLIACTLHPLSRCKQDQSAGTPRRCRIRILASLAIRRPVAPAGEEEAMPRERFEDTARMRVPMLYDALQPGGGCVLTCLSRGTGVPVGATFDVVHC